MSNSTSRIRRLASLLVLGPTLVAGCVVMAAVGACDDPLPARYDGRDVSIDVERVNDETFNIAVHNPNHVRVGVQFRLRIYRWSGQEPETSLENAYIGPGNTSYVPVRTGGCGEPPAPAPTPADGSGAGTGAAAGTGANAAPEPECEIRVSATLLQQYVMARE